MTTPCRYRVVERRGWSYVDGEPPLRDPGPYRYRWEAQEYADRLNADMEHGENAKQRNAEDT